MKNFEAQLDQLFEDAVDVLDMDMRYSDTQTLREAIVELYEDLFYQRVEEP